MSLRTRLTASFTVLLMGVMIVVGVVASREVEGILLRQIDQNLLTIADRGPPPVGGVDAPAIEPPVERLPFLRAFAQVVVDAEGAVILASASGFADSPDPLPDVTELADRTGFTFVDAVDGSLRYRALVRPGSDGSFTVWAEPLDDVSAATGDLVRTLLVAGGIVFLLGAGGTWWMVRRSMRPVEEMVDTAEAIAEGDLSRRVPDLDPGTELGRLGGSLNEMLAHLEDAVETERAGKERLRRFAADASHELRTPVTTIAGYAELRRQGGLVTSDHEERAWDRIESESRRMGSLIEDLMTLARLGETLPLRIETVDVARIVADVAADHRAVDPTRPVDIESPASLRLEADRERLTQVVTNLLANARVHTPEGTSIEITVTDAGDGVRIAVTDDGPGIPQDVRHQVFDRFFRADRSRSRASGGAGLGLAIVQAIAEAHGGSAAVEPGAGE
ncbi:MAG: HAMP domain-containing sensor histidine kinase, partial [Acidimicrobiia bacterium]|nr:HAMP domain-containing sensor histidine kinase [Acidimicrobiia bacterium]